MTTNNSTNQFMKANRLKDVRYENLDTFQIISMVPLHPYQEIADVGAGNGLLSVALAKYLFDGKVHILDTKKTFLKSVESQIQEIGVSNVFTHSYKAGGRLPLETDSLDGVFAACLFSRTKNQSKMFDEIYRSVKPGGWLSIIEWQEESVSGPPVNQRINDEQMKNLITNSNFRFVSKHNLSSCQYMIIARK